MSYRPLRPPRHELVSVRGLKHRITRWGPAGAPPVVLLHGYQDCGATWQFLVDCLPQSWSLAAPDWRGFGGTEWSPGGYWFPDYLADLEALLEALVPDESARIIGHSMGANIAGLYCGVRPARVRWFVNLEGIGLPRTQPEAAPARYARWLDELREPLKEGRYERVEDLAQYLLRRNPLLGEDRADFIARAWTRPASPRIPVDGASSHAESSRAVQLAFDPRHRLVNPVLYRLEEARACWRRVICPVLLVLGAASGHQQRRERDFSDEQVREMFRDVQIVTLPGLGHMMHHEDPQAVADPIIRFANSQS